MADTSIYGRLKRLFSTSTVVRNVGGKKLKIVDSDQIQSFVNRRAVDRYHRVYNNQTGGYGSSQGRYESAAAYHGSRLQLFRDYDLMDMDPIIASVLDIYSDESSLKDEFGEILGIRSNNHQIQEILHNLFYDILNVEFNLWPWVRNLCKYGDFFLYLNIHPEYGIVNVYPLSVYETTRIEGENPENPFSVKFKTETDFLNLGKKDFEVYEIGHFRLLSDTNFLPYGKSMIENGRRIWKQLQLMEDAMLIHRIMRAPDKRKFKVDIGNIPPNEIDQYMTSIINRMKKAPLVDPKTGDYNLRYNMINITEDFYLPVRGKDGGTDIENLPGLQFNAIDDIEYLRKKLMAAFKVPKAFIGYEEDINGKATLAAQDVRFARTIERIQRIVVSELTKIAIIHLYVQGFRDEELVNFDITMSSPSTIYEQEKIALWKEKISLATEIVNSKLLSQDWVYTNILELSDKDIDTQRKKIQMDVKRMGELSQAEQQASSPVVDGTEVQAVDGAETSDETESNKEDVSTDDLITALQKFESEDEDESDELTAEYVIGKKKVGRPKKGYRMNHDGHSLGRDPLGKKENQNALRERNIEPSFVKALELIRGTDYKKLLIEDGPTPNT